MLRSEFDRRRLDQLERAIEMAATDGVPTGTLLASIAISMKRIADAIETNINATTTEIANDHPGGSQVRMKGLIERVAIVISVMHRSGCMAPMILGLVIVGALSPLGDVL
jgi:hypothetical protein